MWLLMPALLTIGENHILKAYGSLWGTANISDKTPAKGELKKSAI